MRTACRWWEWMCPARFCRACIWKKRIWRVEILNAADVRNAVLPAIDFSDANLRSANFRDSNCRGASFRGATLDDADFPGGILPTWTSGGRRRRAPLYRLGTVGGSYRAGGFPLEGENVRG